MFLLDARTGLDDEDDSAERRQCGDCGVDAPETHTAHTLIGTKHGWRLSRTRLPTGDGYLLRWRCPPCWASHKGRDAEQRD